MARPVLHISGPRAEDLAGALDAFFRETCEVAPTLERRSGDDAIDTPENTPVLILSVPPFLTGLTPMVRRHRLSKRAGRLLRLLRETSGPGDRVLLVEDHQRIRVLRSLSKPKLTEILERLADPL
ncbi:MAG: hypothetical protein ACFB6R_12005 [Alphaproteobacteria bacterium]